MVWFRKAVGAQAALIVYCFFVSAVSAKVIHFPDEELAAEYVFPVFDNPQAVLNRNISLSKRLELALSAGLRVDEPLYHILNFSGRAVFYWNEFSGLGAAGLFFMPGLSPTGKKLRTEGVRVKKKPRRKLEQDNPPPADSGDFNSNPQSDSRHKDVFFDPLLAPQPLFASFVNYYFSPWYGKVSVTKKVVFNFNLYSFAGGGVMGFRHGPSELVISPAGQVGLGQKSYLNKWLAVDMGMSLMIYRGPNPISPLIVRDHTQSSPLRPPYKQFKKTIFVRFLVQAGLVILI